MSTPTVVNWNIVLSPNPLLDRRAFGGRLDMFVQEIRLVHCGSKISARIGASAPRVMKLLRFQQSRDGLDLVAGVFRQARANRIAGVK